MAGTAAYLRCDTRLTWCHNRQLVKAGGRQRPDATPILAAVRALNRLEVVAQTWRHALNRRALVAPAWVRTVRLPDGKDHEVRRAEEARFPPTPTARTARARTIGNEGWTRLSAINHPQAPLGRHHVPAVDILRRVWRQLSRWDGAHRHGREAGNLPPAAPCIRSPEDLEAHDALKHTTPWVGDHVPLTETCTDDRPHLIPTSETTIGPAADGPATPKLHTARQPRTLQPGTHIVETGFLDAARLVGSRHDDGVDLLGPTRLDDHWQARERTGFDAKPIQIDGDQPHATCPAGQVSTGWTPAVDQRGHAVLKVTCSTRKCRHCDE